MLKNHSCDRANWLATEQCRLPTLPRPACEGIRDQPAFKMRLAHVHDRVMQNPLGEARRSDDSLFRVANNELLKSADRERAISASLPDSFVIRLSRCSTVIALLQAGFASPARPSRRPVADCFGPTIASNRFPTRFICGRRFFLPGHGEDVQHLLAVFVQS